MSTRKPSSAYVTNFKDNKEYSIILKTLFSMGKKFKLKKRQLKSRTFPATFSMKNNTEKDNLKSSIIKVETFLTSFCCRYY